MKTSTFENYLRDIHAKDYHGTDDDMPDAFDAWLERMDQEDLIHHAQGSMTILHSKLNLAMNIAREAIGELTKLQEIIK